MGLQHSVAGRAVRRVRFVARRVCDAAPTNGGGELDAAGANVQNTALGPDVELGDGKIGDNPELPEAMMNTFDVPEEVQGAVV